MALVKDYMIRSVVSLDAGDSVYDAALLMKEKGVSCVVVKRNRKPAGILTERDVIRRVVCEKTDPSKMLAGDVMSTPLITVSPLMSLDDAAMVIERSGVKKLCVLSGDRIEGIITATDILAAETREVRLLERYVRLLSAEKKE
jgi:CBS domain-containing protein